MGEHGRVKFGYVVAVFFLIVAVVTDDVPAVALAAGIAIATFGAQLYAARRVAVTKDDLSGVLAAWAQGWALSRRARVVEADGGVRVDVGQPDRTMEYVVTDDPATLGSTVDSVRATPGAWLSIVTQDPDATRVWLVDGGLRVGEHAEALMMVDLAEHPARDLPDGYKAEISHAGGVIAVAVTGEDGEQVASGRMSAFSGTAVADRVVTDPAHRRRGLGAAVMSTLVAEARGAGATVGLLVASADGEALYGSLGWTAVARVVVGRSSADPG